VKNPQAEPTEKLIYQWVMRPPNLTLTPRIGKNSYNGLETEGKKDERRKWGQMRRRRKFLETFHALARSTARGKKGGRFKASIVRQPPK